MTRLLFFFWLSVTKSNFHVAVTPVSVGRRWCGQKLRRAAISESTAKGVSGCGQWGAAKWLCSSKGLSCATRSWAAPFWNRLGDCRMDNSSSPQWFSWGNVHGPPHAVSLLNWMPLCEWCMARLVVRNGYRKDMCDHETGLCAQSIVIILRSKVCVYNYWQFFFSPVFYSS